MSSKMDMDMDMGMMNHDTMKMKMYFYWGKDAIVLFNDWPKHSLGMYILAFIFVFILAFLCELLSNQPTLKRGTTPLLGGIYKAGFYLFRISFLYMVMLAVMSFNVGIFIAAVFGHTLGFFITKYRDIVDQVNSDQNRSTQIKV